MGLRLILNEIEEDLESLTQINAEASKDQEQTDTFKGQLGSDATVRKEIPDGVKQSPSLRREDATLHDTRRDHAKMSWISCYNDDFYIHLDSREGAG